MTMDDQDQAADQPVSSGPAPDTFAAVLSLLALLRDEGALHRKLRGLAKALESASAAQKQLVAAQTEFAVFEENTRSALNERETAVSAREVKAYMAEQGLKAREDQVGTRHAEIDRAETRLKKRTMIIGSLDVPGPLQSQPSWHQIAAALVDEHPHPEPEFELSTRRPPDAPEHLTVAQTTFHTPRHGRSMRRQVGA
jgi:hypothetical protein